MEVIGPDLQKAFDEYEAKKEAGRIKSYSEELAKQVPVKESRSLTEDEQKVRDQENARYKEDKRQQRMDEVKKAVNPFKKGGKVRGHGCETRGKTKGKFV